MADGPSRTPTMVGLALVVAALVIAAIEGFSGGSVIGAIVALAAVPASAIGMWKGIQEKTQTGLAMAIGVFGFALLVAAALTILWVISLF